MIVKFNNRGTGEGKGPVEYLLGKNNDRPGARVLQGEPGLITEIINTIEFARKYTSGYLCFEEKNISEKDKFEIMASAEKTLMPGLDPSQYSILWVEHLDKGRLELNFVIANVELTTSKRLQPYYHKRDLPRVDSWKNLINRKYKLTDPNDPRKKQATKKGHLGIPLKVKEIKESLNDQLTELIIAGQIQNRADLITSLNGMGFEIGRETEKYISIKNPNGKRNIKLEGAIYERSFDISKEGEKEADDRFKKYRAEVRKRYQADAQKYKQCFEKAAAYNRKKYSESSRKSNEIFNESDVITSPGDNFLGATFSCMSTLVLERIRAKNSREERDLSAVPRVRWNDDNQNVRGKTQNVRFGRSESTDLQISKQERSSSYRSNREKLNTNPKGNKNDRTERTYRTIQEKLEKLRAETQRGNRRIGHDPKSRRKHAQQSAEQDRISNQRDSRNYREEQQQQQRKQHEQAQQSQFQPVGPN